MQRPYVVILMVIVLLGFTDTHARSSDACAPFHPLDSLQSDTYTAQQFTSEQIDSAAVIFRGRLVAIKAEANATVAEFETIETYVGKVRSHWSVHFDVFWVSNLATFKSTIGDDTVIGLEAQRSRGDDSAPLPDGAARVAGGGMCGPALLAKYTRPDGSDFDGHKSEFINWLWIKGIIPTSIDGNQDGTISPNEIEVFRQNLDDRRAALRAQAEQRAVENKIRANSEKCTVPPIPDGAQLVVIGGTSGTAISTQTVGSKTFTTVTDVIIEPGPDALYIATNSRNVIWRFIGAVDRVKVLLTPKRGSVGVVGLPSSVVKTASEEDCLMDLYHAVGLVRHIRPETNTIRYSATPARNLLAVQAKALFGIEPALIADGARVGEGHILFDPVGTYTLPSGKVEAASRLPGARTVPQSGDVGVLWKRFHQMHPGGVIDIDPASIVTDEPVKPLDVLPEEAGFAQLMASGTLEAIGWRHGMNQNGTISMSGTYATLSNDPGYFRIPFVFRVLKPFTMPQHPAIYSMADPRFVLPEGMPMPSNANGRDCVFREPVTGPLEFAPCPTR